MIRRDPNLMAACFRPPTEDLRGRVVRGTAWIGALMALRALLTVGSTVVLARLLTPADFGLIAMAAVVVELAAMLCNVGLPTIVVQMPRIARLDLDSAFWFSLAMGIAAMALVIAGSPFAAELFKEPRLAPILCAMSVMGLLEELSAVHYSIANRLLLIRYEFYCQMLSLLVRFSASIALAVAGFGVWSLVLGSIVGRAGYCALLWWLIPYVPRLRYNGRFLRRNLRAGGSYFGSAVLFYFGSSIDPAVVGRMFGATQLGYYQTAFALPEELRSRITVAIMRVLLPAFARLQADHLSLRTGVLRSLRVLAAIVIPMGFGMAVLADPIVRVLYGSRWLPVVPLLQLAALIGIVRALQLFLANIYKAKGRPELEFKIGVWLLPLLAVAIFVGSLNGVAGIAVGLFAYSFVSLASTSFALRLIDLDWRAVFRSMLPAGAAATFMAIGLRALAVTEAIHWSSDVQELAACVAIGVILFALPLLAFSRETLADFRAATGLLRAPRAVR